MAGNSTSRLFLSLRTLAVAKEEQTLIGEKHVRVQLCRGSKPQTDSLGDDGALLHSGTG